MSILSSSMSMKIGLTLLSGPVVVMVMLCMLLLRLIVSILAKSRGS